MTNKYKKEFELYYQIRNLFDDKDITFFEVPYNRKRIDIIFTNKSLNNFHAIEAKLYDWKRALKQALLNQIFSQYSYIALPEYKIHADETKIKQLCINNGIGLIAVSHLPQIIVNAKRSEYFDITQHEIVKNYFKEKLLLNPQVLGGQIYEFGYGAEDLELLSSWTHMGKGIISA